MAQSTGRSQVEATIIKKAWADPQYKATLLANPTETYKRELADAGGDPLPSSCQVRVLEETPAKFYLVVPQGAIAAGPAPELHARSTRVEFENVLIQRASRDARFKKELLASPRQAYEAQLRTLKEGASLPSGIQVEAHEESADVLYLRLPQAPAAATGQPLSEAELAQVAGGVVAVGVAVASYVVVGAVAVAALLHHDQETL